MKLVIWAQKSNDTSSATIFFLKSLKKLQYQILFITKFLWKRGVGAEKKNNRNWTTAT